MSSWTYSISWSKMSAALKCPRMLQHLVDKDKPSDVSPTFYAVKGTMVQKVFELYFNQRVNHGSRGDDPEVTLEIFSRLERAGFVKAANPSYPMNKNYAILLQEIREDLLSGFKVLEDMKLLKKNIRSEVKWNGVFRGLRLFAMIDFVQNTGQNSVGIYDGKGSAKPNADPKQVLHYALNVAASGVKLTKSGLIYWKHGFHEVDVSPKALKAYVDEDVNRVRPLFEELKHGFSGEMDTNPSSENCKYCLRKSACKDSYYYKEPQDVREPGKVSFV